MNFVRYYVHFSEKNCNITNVGECFKKFDRSECLSTISAGNPPFDGKCMWCPNGPCHDQNTNRCEPKNWLISEGLWKSEFEECEGISYFLGF